MRRGRVAAQTNKRKVGGGNPATDRWLKTNVQTTRME